MAFLNLSYNFLIYEDSDNSKNPDIRLPDISKTFQQVGVDFDKSERLAVYQNETKTIATTERSLAWDNTTELKIERPFSGQDNIRLKYTGTGTAPSFRVNRQIGGAADTEVTITRLTNYVARVQNTAGTAWTLGSVQLNDLLHIAKTTQTLTSPFAEANQGTQFRIQAVGADYVDVVDNGQLGAETVTLGADLADLFKVISPSPVKTGDLFEVSGAGINPSNHGKFEIIAISDDYIEFINPLAVEETFLFGTNSLVVYEYLIGFVNLRASGPVKLRFGEQSEWFKLNRLGAEAMFLGSVCTHKIEAMNDGPGAVTISIQHSMVQV